MPMTKAIRDEAPQRSLKALGKIYRDFFNRTGDLMMLHDLEGRLLHVNPAVSRLSGYTFEELIGRPIDVFILPKFRNLFREAYLQEINTHGYAEGVVLFQAKDGSAYYVDYRNVLVEEPGFEPYVSGLGRDITARKRVEAALQEAHAEMEQRVKDRTAELVEVNTRLKQESDERSQAVEILRLSQERYTLATCAARIGVWDWNLRTNEFYLDPNVKALLGYRDEEIPNDIEIWSSHVHPDDRQAVMEAFQAHLDEKTPEFVYEHRMLTKDGGICWILARGTAIRDAQGQPMRVVGTDADITNLKRVEEELHQVLDKLEDRVAARTAELAQANAHLRLEISERQRSEEALQENQERYRALANASFEAIFISENGICIDANQTAADMFGYDNGELIGIFGTDVIAPESKERVKHHMLSGYEEPYEAVAQRKDGTHFRVEIRGKMSEYRGRLVRVTVVHDIDRAKKMESRLRESERKYREIFELSPEAIVLLDRSGTVLDVNDRSQEWLGYNREAIIGKRFWDFPFLSDDDKALVRKKFSQRMAGEKVPPYEIGFNAKRGAKRIGRIVATAIRDSKGEIVQDLVMISDITERIQTERELQASEAELQQRSRDLEEVNAALRVLLKNRESDKSDLEERVLVNVKELITPYLQKLKQTRTSSRQQAYLKVLEDNLNEIVSPFYRTLSATYSRLTPKEMQVADMVRQGRTTKEIAALTNSTPRAVEFHRNNIRKKLGLTNRETNLRSYLLTIN